MAKRFFAALMGCVVLAGCTKAPAPTEPTSFAGIVAAAIQEAEAGGAGETQLATLRQAQTDGEVTLETARAAARAAVKCVNDAGSSAFIDERTEYSGLVMPGFSALADTPENDAIAEACRAQENSWVARVYQRQPSSLELTEGYRAQQAPILRTCLERAGYATDPDASPVQLMIQALEARSDDSEVDCIAEAKIE